MKSDFQSELASLIFCIKPGIQPGDANDMYVMGRMD